MTSKSASRETGLIVPFFVFLGVFLMMGGLSGFAWPIQTHLGVAATILALICLSRLLDRWEYKGRLWVGWWGTIFALALMEMGAIIALLVLLLFRAFVLLWRL